MTLSRRYLILFFTSLLLSVAVNDKSAAQAQSLPPASFDGFVFPGEAVEDPILVQAFIDPLGSKSRHTWDDVLTAVTHVGDLVQGRLHPSPSPSLANSYIVSRALHIANILNASSTFPLLEQFFKQQDYFSNERTKNMSRLAVTKEVVKLTAAIVGKDTSLVEPYFEDNETDLLTRTSFEYSARTGVYTTPTFLVNGFMLPGAGSPLDFADWIKILDPLIAQRNKIKKMKYEA